MSSRCFLPRPADGLTRTPWSQRATHTFESDKDGVKEAALGVQYCMCCGESVLILGPEIALSDLPRRRVRALPNHSYLGVRTDSDFLPVALWPSQTDGAIVLQRSELTFKLKSKPRETKVLKRAGGYERQHRFGCWNCGVVLGYRAEDGEDAPITYLLADATGMQADLYLQMFQVPQCIQSTGAKSVRVALDVLVGQTKRALRSVDAEAVAISVVAPAREGLANAELMDFLQKVMAVPRSQLQLSRGWSASSKYLLISGLEAVDVFKRLKAAVETDLIPTGAALGAPPDQANSMEYQVATAGAASSVARRTWEASEELEDLAAAPTKTQQVFIK